MSHFYPRSPCGERLFGSAWVQEFPISIHALLAESDRPWACSVGFGCLFLSTLSLRRATAVQIIIVIMYALFLSTLSLRRATRQEFYKERPGQFLSTLSLRRATRNTIRPMRALPNFYPRSPCGERRFRFLLLRFRFFISIHALLAESDPRELV